MRDGDFRYTEWGPNPDDVELYDLARDPRQRVNLAGDPSHAATQERLAGLLD